MSLLGARSGAQWLKTGQSRTALRDAKTRVQQARGASREGECRCLGRSRAQVIEKPHVASKTTRGLRKPAFGRCARGRRQRGGATLRGDKDRKVSLLGALEALSD